MIDIDYTEVPYLQEILSYLPINPIDSEDLTTYLENVSNVIAINYKYGQYQFSYFGVHLLFMSYIYCSIWKISQIESNRYMDSLMFVRAYNGRENDLHIDINNIDSIFNYSLIPEKDVSKFFKIIELDISQIKQISNLIGLRDEMAHALGKFKILTAEEFDIRIDSILKSMEQINSKMTSIMKKWYLNVVLDFCNGKYNEYSNETDFIEEQMVQNFKLSINELLKLNSVSLSSLISQRRMLKNKINKFKKSLNSYCEIFGV